MKRELLELIVAPATPLARSALAIVRVDGSGVAELVRDLTGNLPSVRQATHIRLHDGDETIDDAVVVRYEGPHSYTGNDLAEFYLHGSPYLVERMVEAAVRRGARIAEPGEFTERAVLNGKIDLVQAEGILSLIESRTALQARIALGQLDGALSGAAQRVRQELLFVISRLEAALDFAEEGYSFIERGEVEGRVGAAIESLEEMLATYARGRAISSGITAVILGQPNAGKSTLMNYLVGSERAIVTDIPGTTRDLLRETVSIGGLPVTLIDTAGLRSSADVVEEIGVARARAAAAEADLVLYLVDASRGMNASDEEELARHPDATVVFTKIDLAAPPHGQIGISIREERGLDELLRLLDEAIRGRYGAREGEPLIVNARQREAVSECRDALVAARESLRNMHTEEVVLVDLYRAASALGRLTGAVTHGEIMGEIFSNFCIGK